MGSRLWRRRRARSSAPESSIFAPVRFLEPGSRDRQLDFSGKNHLAGKAIAHEHVVDGVAAVVALQTEPGGGIRLGIAIDEEDFEAFEREAGGQIDGRSGFAHASLLIDESDDLSHGIPE